MENFEENEEVLIYDEAKTFLEEVKEIIARVLRINKKVEYKSDSLLILSLKDDLHGVFEVYNLDEDDYGKVSLVPKLVYIGDKKLRVSYLLNLINKEEQKAVLKTGYR